MSALVSLFQQNRHWPLVQKVVLSLNKAGYQAFLAGGCVRDGLLGHIPEDFDVATSARPETVTQLFHKSRQQGKAFGVVVVFDSQGLEVEVATFRKDGPYLDGRHPEYVTFLSDKEDALRRDFTINALFYNLKNHNIIDYVGGLADIKSKVIRSVGDPAIRFQEDHLRILRALRFSLKLNFPIEKKTEQVLFKMKNKLMDISKERLYEESLKILQLGKLDSALPIFNKVGLLKEFIGISEETIDWPSHYRFWRDPAPPPLMQSTISLWAMAFFPLLIHQTASSTVSFLQGTAFAVSPTSKTDKKLENANKTSIKATELLTFTRQLKKWNFPVAVIKGLKDIIQFACYILNQEPCSLGKKLRALNSPLAPFVLFLCKRYLKSQGKALDDITDLEQKFKIRALNGKLPKALVNGYDLKALGFKEDKTMAYHLERLYDLQLEQNIKDKKFLQGVALKLFPPQG